MQPTRGDQFAFRTSLAAAALCFGLSVAFHTLRSHSYKVHHFWGRMDILGICVLALGGRTSATYYAFYGNTRIQRIYWGLNFGSAIAAAVTLFDTGGGGSKIRALRVRSVRPPGGFRDASCFSWYGTTGLGSCVRADWGTVVFGGRSRAVAWGWLVRREGSGKIEPWFF